MSESVELNRIDNRLVRIEKLLAHAISMMTAPPKTRLIEKEVIEEFGVSKHILRRLRMGYKRTDGVEVPPQLTKWRHYNGRNFDYDRAELEAVLRKSTL